MADSMEKLNVLWLVDHLGLKGSMHGASMYYLNTIPVFDKNKINVTLCVLRKEDNLTEYFREKGIKILNFGRGKFDPMTLVDILNITRKERIDLLHAHGYGAANFGRLAGMIRGIPVIMHAHDDDRNYPLHQKLADQLLSRFTDRAIAVSGSVKESCVKKRNMSESKTFVMHNGISLGNFNTPEAARIQAERNRLGVGLGVKVVGTVGKLREEKGTKYFIESAGKVLELFPETLFVIAGDGPLMEELKYLSRKLEIANKVVFAGFCQDIPAILSIMDVVVIPSLTEGSPLALLEAMAMGKPIIATSVGGITEILRDGETGLLVPSKDPVALAEKIKYFFGNMNEAMNLGRRAKEESKKYDINAHVKTLENHYRDILSGKIGKG